MKTSQQHLLNLMFDQRKSLRKYHSIPNVKKKLNNNYGKEKTEKRKPGTIQLTSYLAYRSKISVLIIARILQCRLHKDYIPKTPWLLSKTTTSEYSNYDLNCCKKSTLKPSCNKIIDAAITADGLTSCPIKTILQ